MTKTVAWSKSWLANDYITCYLFPCWPLFLCFHLMVTSWLRELRTSHPCPGRAVGKGKPQQALPLYFPCCQGSQIFLRRPSADSAFCVSGWNLATSCPSPICGRQCLSQELGCLDWLRAYMIHHPERAPTATPDEWQPGGGW